MNNYVVHDIKLYKIDFQSFRLVLLLLSVNNTSTSVENRGKIGYFANFPPCGCKYIKFSFFYRLSSS